MIEKFAPNQAANPANFSIITLVQARYCRRNEARPGTFRPDASVPRPAALARPLHCSGYARAPRVHLGGRNAAVPRSSRAAPAGHGRRHRILLRLHDGLIVPPMRKGPCREAARPLSIGEPRPRERDGRHKASAEFRRAHSTKCHWRLRVEPDAHHARHLRACSRDYPRGLMMWSGGRWSMSDEHPETPRHTRIATTVRM